LALNINFILYEDLDQMRTQSVTTGILQADRNKQRGFTLIELMIVVSIISILASIAIPAYNAYTLRAKLTEAVGVAVDCKNSVFEYYVNSGVWPLDISSAGCSSLRTANVVSSMTVLNGAITVNIYGTRTGIGGACKLMLSPNTDGSLWTGSTTCPKQYVPASFR
jgi:type IV pilus assembly protein PilA